jgi:hypothetical protein
MIAANAAPDTAPPTVRAVLNRPELMPTASAGAWVTTWVDKPARTRPLPIPTRICQTAKPPTEPCANAVSR